MSAGLAAIWLALTFTGCALRERRTIEAASSVFSCPENTVTVTDLGENQYRAVGCGKQDVFLCDYVTENEYTAAQRTSLVCRPGKKAIEDTQRATQVGEACANACNSGAIACSQGCEDQSCRNACGIMADGCMKGCVASQR